MFISFTCITIIGLAIATQQPLLVSTRLIIYHELQYLFGAFASVVLYRTAPTHRLYQFPGPRAYKISKLAHAFQNRDLKGFRNLSALHERYGDYVRTGPSELSIIDPDSIPAIHGHNSKCTRAAWYSMADPLRAIFHTRDKTEHEKRKKIWEKSFSIRSLRAYESRIESHIALFLQKIAEEGTNERPLNASHWLNYLSFDIMGEVGFGKGFDLLEKGGKLEVLKILENGQKGLGVLGTVPWLFMIVTKIPMLKKEHDIFVRWCEKQMLDRKERKTPAVDVMGVLLEDDSAGKNLSEAHQWLCGDSRILIVAGSDSVASSLAFTFYYLAKDEEWAAAIRAELLVLQQSDELDASRLQKDAVLLNAFITETLRLWPPNPSGVLRQTPKEGLKIGDKYIPGDVTICTPLWTLHRSPKCFVSPLDFIPERWTTRPHLVLRRDAYVPFMTGTYGCIGKQLALMEMRLIVARVLLQFEVRFAGRDANCKLLEDSKDWFTFGLEDMVLEFTKCE